MGEQEVDPYEPDGPFTYECGECTHRVEAAHQPEECPECSGEMIDLSVPRE
jgi:rubrerythrin